MTTTNPTGIRPVQRRREMTENQRPLREPFAEHLRGCACLTCFARWMRAKRESA